MVTLELNIDLQCEIVNKSLKETYENMCDDHYTKSMFSMDEKENKKKVKKFKKAVKRVYEYYSVDKLD